MISRREWLERTLGAGAAMALSPGILAALQQKPLITRAIPSTGEMIPVIGLGSADSFSRVAGQQDFDAVRSVMKALVESGCRVLDTAPSYGASEEVCGKVAKELGVTDKIFWATKVNVARGATADPAAARAQIEASFTKLGVSKIDLIQVHNLGDPPTQLAILKDLKRQGRIRYIGITSTSETQYSRLAEVMRNEPLDFIGVDYAIDNREVEAEILPLAQERKIGVLVYLPFGRRRLFSRTQGKPLPDFAKEIDAATWGQFLLKYIVSHPAVTAATPGTSQGIHMTDNAGAATGRMPNEAMRKRMAAFIDALPA